MASNFSLTVTAALSVSLTFTIRVGVTHTDAVGQSLKVANSL